MTTMMSLFDGAVTEMNYYEVGIRVRRSYIILGVHHTSHSSSQIITFLVCHKFWKKSNLVPFEL